MVFANACAPVYTKALGFTMLLLQKTTVAESRVRVPPEDRRCKPYLKLFQKTNKDLSVPHQFTPMALFRRLDRINEVHVHALVADIGGDVR